MKSYTHAQLVKLANKAKKQGFKQLKITVRNDFGVSRYRWLDLKTPRISTYKYPGRNAAPLRQSCFAFEMYRNTITHYFELMRRFDSNSPRKVVAVKPLGKARS